MQNKSKKNKKGFLFFEKTYWELNSIEDLKPLFKRMDVDDDGKLSPQELKLGLRNVID